MNDFAQRIITLRKELSMTQEQLAQELGITAQAVSKWETGQSYPDITLLPKLAEVFHVRVDELLGVAQQQDEEAEEDASEASASAPLDLPWDDDPHTIHAVLFAGHRLIGAQGVTDCPEASRITFEYEGPALNIDSVFSVSCGDITGNVQAGGSVNCDSVGGSVTAGGSVNCADVSGDIKTSGSVACDAVEGNVASGGSVNCDNVTGSVTATGSVTCGDVGGNVTAGGSLSCEKVHGGASSAPNGFSFQTGSGKKRGKSASFQFGGGFDSKQFERSMNELGQKLGRLGKELGEQFSSAFDSSASGKNEDDGGEDTFVCVTDDEN